MSARLALAHVGADGSTRWLGQNVGTIPYFPGKEWIGGGGGRGSRDKPSVTTTEMLWKDVQLGVRLL